MNAERVNEEGVIIMAKMKSGDRCADCSQYKEWKSDSAKGTCKLGKRPQGFHPDSKVPQECVGKMTRAY